MDKNNLPLFPVIPNSDLFPKIDSMIMEDPPIDLFEEEPEGTEHNSEIWLSL